MRTIKQVIPAQKVDMGGILLDQPLPYGQVDQIDPFLLLHHWKQELPGGRKQEDTGVGPHPHRGFSPVTFLFQGAVYHQDSRGNRSLVKAGGTQWLDSGMGIIHSERPAKELAEEGGTFELIQFWVNTPAKYKMAQPDYQPLQREDTPVWNSPDGLTEVAVVAGALHDVKGPIRTKTDLLALRLDLRAGAQVSLPVPDDYNVFLYTLDGKLEVGAEQIPGRQLVWFNTDGEGVGIQALEDTRAILLAGRPIGEPKAAYGPFVMNTQTEIMQALRDYQMGKMGVLVEQFSEPAQS